MRIAAACIFPTLAVQFSQAANYFPPGILGRTPAASEAAANRYSTFLEFMHEPSLLELAQRDPNAEVYRLLWLREFDRPASIRFAMKPNGTGWFYRRLTGGKGGAQPGRISDSGMSWSSKSRTSSFLSAVERAGFWDLPTIAGDDLNTVSACRSHWILEGIRNGQYHVVDRCSPDQSDPIRVVGVLAMKLGSLRVHGSRVY